MMKKMLSICSFVLLLIIFTGCSKAVEYELMNDKTEIASIEIVKLGKFDSEEDSFGETVISVIEDHDGFLKEFNEVDCSNHLFNPSGVYEGETLVKITYKNGEYELIDYDGQGKYQHFDKHPSNFDAYSGYRDLDKKQFEALIEKYSSQ